MTCATVSLAVLAAAVAQNATQTHPFLFTTPDDIARARRGMEDNAHFADLAEELIEEARETQLADLPSLETAWWDAAQHKPWAETYPEIFHHTWIVPQQHAKLARDAARAFLLTDDETLAAKAHHALLGLADYSFAFEHYDVGMNYTVWNTLTLDAYDLLYHRFSAEDHARMDAYFERLLAAVVKNDEFWIEHEPGGRMNNHYAWHKLCRCMIGLFYQHPERVEQAIHGPKGVQEMFRYGFRDEGLWLEGSIPYQFAATAAFTIMAEMLANSGHDFQLWDYKTDDGRTLKQSYDALFDVLLPDKTLPPLGDSYAVRPHLGSHIEYEILYRRFGDARYAWLLSDYGERAQNALFHGATSIEAGKAPALYTQHWPEHGYVALRSQEGVDYWRGDGTTLFTTYSNSPVHTNADKLSIMLFGQGHLWLPDCEAKTGAEHAFSAQIQSLLNRETVCHNTVLIDGQSQAHPDRRLDLVEYYALPDVKRTTVGDLDGRLYPGVRQLRTCLVLDDYTLDVFQVSAESARQIDWMIHVDGVSQKASIEQFLPATFPDAPPWRFLRAPQRSDSHQRVWETFMHEDKHFRYDLFASAPFELIRCGFPREDSLEPDTWPMRLARCTTDRVCFTAVYRTSDASPMSIHVEDGPHKSLLVTLTFEDKTQTHVAPRLE